MSRKKTEYVSPSPSVFRVSGPTALQREETTRNQIRWDEGTIKYGDDDCFPLRIIDAVNQSPTATSCVGTIQTFIRGAGFSNASLMETKIDKDGTTLWALHCSLCEYMAMLDGFSVNFKFDASGKISAAYLVNLETVRFKKPPDGSSEIDCVKVNPYFGTTEYQKRFTKEYPLWNPSALSEQIQEMGTQFPGQIYYYGSTRPPFKFYPVPKYWSGQQWIYVDGQIQQFHKKNLDNGFFQSVLMTQIGNPNEWSKNPRQMATETALDGVTKIQKPTKTVGEEYNEQMSKTFSGVDKAGAVFTVWANSIEQRPTLESFPVNSNFDILSGTFTDAIRGITIATEVPAILANLPQQNSSLGSDGNAMSMATQLMQSRTSGKRRILENFYNTILLPNLQTPVKERVEILDYSPISSALDFYNFKAFELYWAFMNPQEKEQFVNNNISEIKLQPRPAAATPVPGTTISPDQPAPMQINDNLKNLTGRQNQNFARIIRDFSKGKISSAIAGLMLKNGFGLTEQEINEALGIDDEELNPVSVSQ